MMRSRDWVEVAVGGIVFAAAVLFLVYVNAVADGSNAGDRYELVASFGAANGIAAGSDVRIAGVRIGSVRAVEIDYDRYRAEVRMQVSTVAQIPEDSSAEVRADGLFGGSYISVVPGASDRMLADGETFEHTLGSVDLIEILGRAFTSGG